MKNELLTNLGKIEDNMRKNFAQQKADNSRIQQQITSLKGEKTALQQQLLGKSELRAHSNLYLYFYVIQDSKEELQKQNFKLEVMKLFSKRHLSLVTHYLHQKFHDRYFVSTRFLLSCSKFTKLGIPCCYISNNLEQSLAKVNNKWIYQSIELQRKNIQDNGIQYSNIFFSFFFLRQEVVCFLFFFSSLSLFSSKIKDRNVEVTNALGISCR